MYICITCQGTLSWRYDGQTDIIEIPSFQPAYAGGQMPEYLCRVVEWIVHVSYMWNIFKDFLKCICLAITTFMFRHTSQTPYSSQLAWFFQSQISSIYCHNGLKKIKKICEPVYTPLSKHSTKNKSRALAKLLGTGRSYTDFLEILGRQDLVVLFSPLYIHI